MVDLGYVQVQWALSTEQWIQLDVPADSGSIAPLRDLARHEKEKEKISKVAR